ncbi:MAG: CSLREA domain-containing protein [Phycisphaerales bacterium]|nr:CSLREA domain-containing protein [Phycisphaerales bacterium]
MQELKMRRKESWIGLSAAAVLLASMPAAGDVFDVNTFEDGNDGACNVRGCTLREAINACTGTPGNDTILLDAGVYTLSVPGNDNGGLGGDLDVNFGQVEIVGFGKGVTIIDADGINRVFDVGPLNAPTSLILRDLTIRGGVAQGLEFAGGVRVFPGSTLVLDNVEVLDCHAGDDGGGLWIGGEAYVADSLVSGCSVTFGSGNGGGIWVSHSGTTPGVLTLERSVVSGNSAPNGGGGLSVRGDAFIIDSTIGPNGGTFPTGILYPVTWAGNVVAERSTFTGLTGVVLLNSALNTLSMTNCTVSGNGGGVPAIHVGFGGGTASLDHCTVTANASGGIGRFGGTVTLHGTIVAGNGGGDINGAVVSEGWNLIGSTAGASISGDTTGNLLNMAPLLGPLADNGGYTMTHAAQTGSPAIDAADLASSPNLDQRGFLRPLDGDGNGSVMPDIGAVEVSLAPVKPGDLDGNGVVDGADVGAMLGQWGGAGSGDLDGNGIVDGADLGLLLANWGG